MAAGRILIVGGGVAGLATAWSLGRRGARDMVLLERERRLATHSSRLNAAILLTPDPDPSIEALTQRGGDFLRRPPGGFSERLLLDPCGVILATAPLASPHATWERRALELGIAEEIPPARLPKIAPHLSADGLRCLWSPSDGRIDIDALLDGFERGARAAGAHLEVGAGVRELLMQGTTVVGARLEDGREIRGEKTVIAAGGWAGKLAAEAGSRIRLRPTRRHLVVTEVDPRIDPRWPVVWVEDDPFYARPESGGMMISACDEVDVDPDALAPMNEVRDLALATAAGRLPGLLPLRCARFWSGVRTLTEDGRFVIGTDPDVPGLFWAAGLGGHGMGCAHAVGEIAAKSLLGEPAEDPAARACDPSRFAARSPVP